jgi:non-homologous end joining protein Ku
MAAAARPYWTGFPKLSLVTIAVRLYSATTEKERVQFHGYTNLRASGCAIECGAGAWSGRQQ